MSSGERYEPLGDISHWPASELVGMQVLPCPNCEASFNSGEELFGHFGFAHKGETPMPPQRRKHRNPFRGEHTGGGPRVWIEL